MKGKWCRWAAVWMAALLMLAIPEKVEAAKKVPSLSKTKLELVAGNSQLLTLKNFSGTVKWSASKKGVISLKKLKKNKVRITAKKKGTSVITARTKDRKYVCRVKVTEKKYRYLALGNSMAIHGRCSYWWENYGMAASSADKDYVHQTAAGLKKKYKNVEWEVYDIGLWEIAPQQRKSIVRNIGAKLDTKRDLITVQIGDNIRNIYGFQQNYEELLACIKKKNPKAKIVVVGNFWQESSVKIQAEAIKKAAAAKYKAGYADLRKIVGIQAYRRGLGAVIWDSAGVAHTVTNSGVADHPNDIGMAYIAEQILKSVKK